MATPNYGRERPTPPHVMAHDNPTPRIAVAFQRMANEIHKLQTANDQFGNQSAARSGDTSPQKRRYNQPMSGRFQGNNR